MGGVPHDYLFWRTKPNIAVRSGTWQLRKVNQTDLDVNSVTDVAANRHPRKAWPQDSPDGQMTPLYDLSVALVASTNVAREHPEVVQELGVVL